MTTHNDTNTGLAAQVRKTAIKLADGRDLFYFDDSEPYLSGEKTRRSDDPRPLTDRLNGPDAMKAGPQMRQDPLTGDWISMASHRMNRTFLPPADANPLAPARPGAQYQDGEVPDTDYDVVVFENRFPSLIKVPADPAFSAGPSGAPSLDQAAAGLPAGSLAPATNAGQGAAPDLPQWFVEDTPLWPAAPAAGRCEVVCFGPDVNTDLVQMGPGRMRTVIEAWADRTFELSQLEHIQQVFCFENHGQDIGVTLSHPHGQIYAYPYLTPRTQAMLRQAKAFTAANPGKNLVHELALAEEKSGRRMIARNDHWLLYVPVAARWPIEFHLAPRQAVPDLAALSDEQRQSLADIYLRMMIIANHFHRDPATGEYIAVNYITAWHQAPTGEDRQYLSLFNQFFSFLRAPGKLKYLAGSESGMAAWISDTTPEIIADRARAAAAEAEAAGAFAGLKMPVEWIN